MMYLGHDRYCDEIVTQTDCLRAILADADLSLTVPTCPEWDLGELARHVGGAHRWVAEIVRTRATEDIPDGQVPGEKGPSNDDPDALSAWLAQGAAELASLLRDAGPDTAMWSWGWERNGGFWSRRIAHETLVHCADGAVTAGVAFDPAPDIAGDCIDEWLRIVRYAQDKGGDPDAEELRIPGTIQLHVTDVPGADWLISLGPDGITWAHEPGQANVTLQGPLTELMLAFNRRQAVDEGSLEVVGDRALLDYWLDRAKFG